MDPTVFTRGRAASWRTGWPITSFRGRRTNEESLLLRCTHRLTRQLPIWPNENQKTCVRKQTWSASAVFFFLVHIRAAAPANPSGRCVCGRVTTSAIMWSGTMAGLLFPAWPAPCQPPDSSRLVFNPSLPWPSSPLSPNFPLQLSQGPHWEYRSDPGLWAPKPALILLIDRPENFLTGTAGAWAHTLHDPEELALLT